MYEINIKIFIIYKAVVENIASHEITYLSLIEMEFEVAVRISYIEEDIREIQRFIKSAICACLQ